MHSRQWGEGISGIADIARAGEPAQSASTDGRHDWYTLDGRRLSARPSRPGIYFHDGRKVVVR